MGSSILHNIVVLASLWTSTLSQCPVNVSSGMLTLRNEADIELAAQHCTNASAQAIETIVVGALRCQPHPVNGLTSSSISKLEDVIASSSPTLRIECLTELEAVSGLDTVTRLRGLIIQYNPSLESITGLNHLTEIDGELTINQNWRLKTFNGLSSLRRIENFLRVERNPNLTSLDAMPRLRRIGGDVLFGSYAVSVLENWKLTTLSGLRSLSSITWGTVHIEGNPRLCFAGYPQWPTGSVLHSYVRRPAVESNQADLGVDWRSVLDSPAWMWQWRRTGIPTLLIRNNAPWDKCGRSIISAKLRVQVLVENIHNVALVHVEDRFYEFCRRRTSHISRPRMKNAPNAQKLCTSHTVCDTRLDGDQEATLSVIPDLMEIKKPHCV